MPAHGLHHYNLTASREVIEALRDFYCNVLGLIDGARPPFESAGHWLYAGDSDILHLTVADVPVSAPTPAKTTLDHIAFRCTDFKAMLERLDARRVPYTVDEVPLLRQRQVFLHDPVGNGIELNFFDGDSG